MSDKTQDEQHGDLWIDWLLKGRHSPKNMRYMRQSQAEIESYADRVLQHAKLEPNDTMVDVGAGEGLVSLKAIDRIGPSLRVILTDISQPLLNHAEKLATERGVANQCTFLQCSAHQLTAIASESVDVVITRAALAYVEDKQTAFQEFFRILKPGGRISLAEPVFRDDAITASVMRSLMESQIAMAGKPDPFTRLTHIWRSSQFPDDQHKIATNALTNYTERDFVQWAMAFGFKGIHLELHIDVKPSFVDWDTFLETSPHPYAPTLQTIMQEKFTPEERQLFADVMKPIIESDSSTSNYRVAYLSAQK
ncbi:MAG TPA: class I SAM-dependent methyltransferase [Methylophilaceae bacterium]|jgi:ubiquinone/menaquinone biosynthesis C-methylase UbiE